MEILPVTALFGVPGHLEQDPGIALRFAGIEHGAPGDQEVGPRFDDLNNGFFGYAAIHSFARKLPSDGSCGQRLPVNSSPSSSSAMSTML